MADINEPFKVDEWGDLLWRIRQGDHPTRAELLEAMDSATSPMPAELVKYAAQRFREKRERGRPPASLREREKRAYRAYELAIQVALRHAELKRQGTKGPRKQAIEEIASEQRPIISARTLRDLLQAGRKEWRTLPVVRAFPWPSLRFVQRYPHGRERKSRKKIAN